MRKRDAQQHFWKYVEAQVAPVPVALKFLTSRNRVYVTAEAARRAHDYFRQLGFSDDETGNFRTPIELVDYFGNPVSLTAVA
ncbi:MAG: hypothetical protein ACRDPC_18635 [Solirubrobacteraceae bacterium]